MVDEGRRSARGRRLPESQPHAKNHLRARHTSRPGALPHATMQPSPPQASLRNQSPQRLLPKPKRRPRRCLHPLSLLPQRAPCLLRQLPPPRMPMPPRAKSAAAPNSLPNGASSATTGNALHAARTPRCPLSAPCAAQKVSEARSCASERKAPSTSARANGATSKNCSGQNHPHDHGQRSDRICFLS